MKPIGEVDQRHLKTTIHNVVVSETTLDEIVVIEMVQLSHFHFTTMIRCVAAAAAVDASKIAIEIIIIVNKEVVEAIRGEITIIAIIKWAGIEIEIKIGIKIGRTIIEIEIVIGTISNRDLRGGIIKSMMIIMIIIMN
jgi:hypothetical protein